MTIGVREADAQPWASVVARLVMALPDGVHAGGVGAHRLPVGSAVALLNAEKTN